MDQPKTISTAEIDKLSNSIHREELANLQYRLAWQREWKPTLNKIAVGVVIVVIISLICSITTGLPGWVTIVLAILGVVYGGFVISVDTHETEQKIDMLNKIIETDPK